MIDVMPELGDAARRAIARLVTKLRRRCALARLDSSATSPAIHVLESGFVTDEEIRIRLAAC